MSFKDCVNTKDCGKMQTDIEDVKDSISGITDDVETITDTTIPAIEDEIAGLDDRVSTLENESGDMKDWELYDGTDWTQFSTDGKANQELILRLVSRPMWSNSATSTHTLKDTGIEIHIKKGDVFSNTDIEDNDNIHSIFTGDQTSGTYYSALGMAKFILKGISDNTSILTSTSVKIKVQGAVLFISSTNASMVSSNTEGRVITNDLTLTKNGTSVNKIFLYYRPTE